jgi:hypothetical protein
LKAGWHGDKISVMKKTYHLKLELQWLELFYLSNVLFTENLWIHCIYLVLIVFNNNIREIKGLLCLRSQYPFSIEVLIMILRKRSPLFTLKECRRESERSYLCLFSSYVGFLAGSHIRADKKVLHVYDYLCMTVKSVEITKAWCFYTLDKK